MMDKTSEADASYCLMDERKKTAFSEVVNFFRAIESDEKIKDKWCPQEQVSKATGLCIVEPDLMESWLNELSNDQTKDGEVVRPKILEREKRDGVWFYRLVDDARPKFQ